MYTLEDVYKTFPSGCTEDYKILRAFEMGKQTLEKENERLTDELKSLKESIKDYGAGCYENGLRNGKRKLEEQIAELKAENEANENGAKKYAEYYFETNDQLTKAKEIIKDLLGSENTSCEEEMFFEIRQKAKQFLSEVEK